MKIYLYQNVSENHRVSKNLTNALEYEGTLRNASSVIDPSFTIESIANLSNYNYCYIPDFNRYYFITSIDVLSPFLWGFGCHVDVLMTYASQIKECSAVIARQEFNYNLYLPDDKLMIECDRDIVTLGFPTELSPASGGKSFVITIAGG